MNKKYLILVIVFVVVIIAAVLFWPKNPNKQIAKSYDVNNNPYTPDASQTPVADIVKKKSDTLSPVSDTIFNTGKSIFTSNGIFDIGKSVLTGFGLFTPAPAPSTISANGTDSAAFIKKYFPSLYSAYLSKGTAVLTGNPVKFPLKVGSKGNEVLVLQFFLNAEMTMNKKNTPQLVMDGNFGAKTKAALQKIIPTGELTLQKYNDSVLPFVNSIMKST